MWALLAFILQRQQLVTSSGTAYRHSMGHVNSRVREIGILWAGLENFPMPPKKSALRFSSQQRVVLPGSEKAPLPAATGEKPARPASVITVSVIVKRKSPLNTSRLGKDRLTRAQYRQKHAADPAAIKAGACLCEGVWTHRR